MDRKKLEIFDTLEEQLEDFEISTLAAKAAEKELDAVMVALSDRKQSERLRTKDRLLEISKRLEGEGITPTVRNVLEREREDLRKAIFSLAEDEKSLCEAGLAELSETVTDARSSIIALKETLRECHSTLEEIRGAINQTVDIALLERRPAAMQEKYTSFLARLEAMTV